MLLLTKEIKRKLPDLYATEEVSLKDKIVVAKFFDPCGAYTLYIIEGREEDDDFTLWGWATFGDPDCAEFGYSSLNEIKAVKNRFGLGIERDAWWTPKAVKDIPEIMRTIPKARRVCPVCIGSGFESSEVQARYGDSVVCTYCNGVGQVKEAV